jgi:ankyrin repeat protein
MYPNPQEALPLAPRPHLEQYRKLAKELVKACRSQNPSAISTWAEGWLGKLAALYPTSKIFDDAGQIQNAAARVAQFAGSQFSHGETTACSLTTAQFVIARALGFPSWPRLVNHVESLRRAGSPVSAYERAVEAIVSGDLAALKRLLRRYPSLARARSTREHGATLLHYVSANGVEGYRQISPNNSHEIAEILLQAGAEVDATTDVYEGKCTALGLVATSSPPYAAGVQRQVMDVLLRHGARLDLPGSAGHGDTLVRSCLANGQPAAADYLASLGAPLDLEGAAGLGRLAEVERLIEGSTSVDVLAGFAIACAYGRAPVVEFLLTRGIEVDVELKSHGAGHTGLHVAAFHGQLDAVRTLLQHGARVDSIDRTWKTPPLTWALTGWKRSGHAGQYYEVVAHLVGAGSKVTPDMLTWDEAKADPKMLAALRGA